MNVTTIEVEKEEALKKYKEYLEAEKKHKSREYSAARRAYRALSKGLKVIDIYDAFRKTGLKADGNPKLAIVRADVKEVFFVKRNGGAGKFSASDETWRDYVNDVVLPEDTFKPWATEIVGASSTSNGWRKIIQEHIVTNVPFIPAHIPVPGKLENYYILFEVQEWKDARKSSTAKTRDPYLLQRLNDNTFVVLAEWDVSPVEAIVMRSAT